MSFLIICLLRRVVTQAVGARLDVAPEAARRTIEPPSAANPAGGDCVNHRFRLMNHWLAMLTNGHFPRRSAAHIGQEWLYLCALPNITQAAPRTSLCGPASERHGPLHPTAAGRTYAAYGGMYIAVALIWLRVVDGVALTRGDVTGAAIALVGMAVITLQPMAGSGP